MLKTLVVLFSFAAFAGAAHPDAEKDVLAAMNKWRQAMVARDRAALDALYDPGLSYTHSNGKLENKPEAIEAVVNGKDRIESIEWSEISVKIYGTTAVVKTKLTMRTAGNTLNLDVLYVWIKNSSGWRMVARQAIRLN